MPPVFFTGNSGGAAINFLSRIFSDERISSVVISKRLCYTNESWNIFLSEFVYFYLIFTKYF